MPVTLEDIARALNVSKMTVSRAINNHPEISRQTRARILATAQKMKYRPNQFARALTTNHSYLIGIVVPDLMHSYFAEICRGIEAHARPAGYQNLICSTDEEARKEMDEIEALLSRTDGLIVASALPATEAKFYRRLISEGANIVLIDRLLDGLRCSAVTTDDVQVGILATEHLIKLGHRKIGHLRGPNVSTSNKRLEGYQRAIKKAGLKSSIRDCGFTESDGYVAMQKWIASGNLPSAIFAANDPAAIGAMAAIDEAGLKVPDDVAFVGAGSIHYGDMLRVPLTTVSWSKAEMGQAAASLLLELIDGEKKARRHRTITVPPELLIRQSSGQGSNR
ncbi:MAG TPA: LacI family DNA-binding transcriptional regulator [Pyrinomonadaceae bacterium]|jgi:LacI family transcriptional regulator|nr:LacI family DNA-binding transcriptional regulator [Pyrinomonadaceae bacterium]